MTYILFGGHCYYPAGGADDLVGKYETIKEAKDAFFNLRNEIKGCSYLDIWGQITDEDLNILLTTNLESNEEPSEWS